MGCDGLGVWVAVCPARDEERKKSHGPPQARIQLIELLVVMAIIGVLVALLVPQSRPLANRPAELSAATTSSRSVRARQLSRHVSRLSAGLDRCHGWPAGCERRERILLVVPDHATDRAIRGERASQLHGPHHRSHKRAVPNICNSKLSVSQRCGPCHFYRRCPTTEHQPQSSNAFCDHQLHRLVRIDGLSSRASNPVGTTCPGNGVFFLNSKVSIPLIHDGTSHTILCGERRTNTSATPPIFGSWPVLLQAACKPSD